MNCVSLISKYRSQLMGFAMVIVVIFHMRLWESTSSEGLTFVFEIAYGGVDIFFLLSGFGLYYSSLNIRSVGSFYNKRVIRIIPAYVIVLALYYFVFNSNYTVCDWLYNVSTLSFWISYVQFEWYVPSIILLYLLFPLLNVFLKKNLELTLIVVTLLSLVLFLCFTLHADYIDTRKLFLSRIPVFCLGIFFGKLSLDKTRTYKTVKYFFMLMSIPACAFLYILLLYYRHLMWHGLLWYSFFIIAPGICFLLADIFEKIKEKSLVCKCLDFVGKISLEIYLVHVLLNIPRKYFIASGKYDLLLINLIYIVASLLFAYMLSIFVEKLLFVCLPQKKMTSD